jgi:hypothetical protein
MVVSLATYLDEADLDEAMTSAVTRMILVGVVAILAFDVLASLASRTLGFSYVYATPGSWFIYAVVGYAIGRIAPVSYATVGVVIVGIAEATIGWWLSWLLGPGRTQSGTITSTQVITAVVSIIVIAAIIGAASGSLGRARPRLSSTSSVPPASLRR